MKIYSLPQIPGLNAGNQVNAEVMATESGRSLVLLNGILVNANSSLSAGTRLSGQLAATEGGFNIVTNNNSDVVSAEKLLNNAGIHENTKELVIEFRKYGVTLSKENLQIASEILKDLPQSAVNKKLNASVIALLLAKKLPVSSFSLLRDYIHGNLKFSALMANIDKGDLAKLKGDWSKGQLFHNLQKLITDGLSASKANINVSTGIEELIGNLQLQELMTCQKDTSNESRTYFQWPIFWNDSDLPDTLEGEVFVPDDRSSEQGFSLRLIINPQSLGRMEIAINQLKDSLWVHFGVEHQTIESIKSLFQVLREKLINEDIKIVRFTVGRVRLLDNFFSNEISEPENNIKIAAKIQKIDFKI